MKGLRTYSHQRGNVVLTALFVAVFLFFLSIALLLAHKQDISLALSMEHKLKAEMAARSVAFEAYGHLREHGKLIGALGQRLEKDVTTRVEVLELPATPRRGKLIEIRAKGTSGPVTSYMTMCLQPTELAQAADGAGRVMILPQGDAEAYAIYGNFELVGMKQVLPNKLFANDGPVFTCSPLGEPVRPAFTDTLPVFGEGEIQGVGPLIVLGPAPAQNTETSLQWLELKGDVFEWQPIAPPDKLATTPAAGPAPTAFYEMNAGAEWTHASAHGEGTEMLGWSWVDLDPPTQSLSETGDSLATFGPVSASPLVAYEAGQVQQSFTTRGTLAAQGEDVYSHGWHYLYQPHRGEIPDPLTPLNGARLTRWPCVLKYGSQNQTWSLAWSPLDDDGTVRTMHTPHPDFLWATSKGALYSLTSSGERKLMQLMPDGEVKLSDGVLPDGQVFFYRDKPHVLTVAPSRIVNLEDRSTIDFATLPTGVPGYHGTLLDIPQGQSLRYDEPGTNDISPEGAFKITGYKTQTVLPDVLLSYAFSETARPMACGDDLYVELDVVTQGVDSIHDVFDHEYIEKNTLVGGPAMARYDGERWYILPNGLRAFLERERQRDLEPSAPPFAIDENDPAGRSRPQDQKPKDEDEEEEQPRKPGDTLDIPPGMANAVMAKYPGLPSVIPRYSVISVSTDPFESQSE